jgi:hypothetical protein
MSFVGPALPPQGAEASDSNAAPQADPSQSAAGQQQIPGAPQMSGVAMLSQYAMLMAQRQQMIAAATMAAQQQAAMSAWASQIQQQQQQQQQALAQAQADEPEVEPVPRIYVAGIHPTVSEMGSFRRSAMRWASKELAMSDKNKVGSYPSPKSKPLHGH